MLYLSQLLNKTIYFAGKPYGKIIDMAILENLPNATISKIEIKVKNKKLTVSPQVINFQQDKFILQTKNIPLLPFDSNDFYLAEDLLDKQVINMDGRKLVRVNDVLLDNNGSLKVMGIDVGVGGILRRLGLGKLQQGVKILPWKIIEAFDYQTGNIRLKLTEKSLNELHPAELADILEEAGIKERLGILSALDIKKAARALEETDSHTQAAMLDTISTSKFKEIINKMHTYRLADVFYYLNPLRAKVMQTSLDSERTQRISRLLSFSHDTAGGMMQTSFFSIDGATTTKEVCKILSQQNRSPECIIVTNGGGKIAGIIYTKELIHLDSLALLKDVISEKKFVYPETGVHAIIKLFAQYNLRSLPVIDKEKKPIGIVLIDDILRMIEEDQDKYENL